MFPRIYFNDSGDKDKIQTIEQWGAIEWTSMLRAFKGCTNLTITNANIDTPNLSNATELNNMFRGASSFNYDISNWDVSLVNTTSGMFREATSFDQDLSEWDVSNVSFMTNMFKDVTLSTANYDAILIGWNNLTLQNGVIFNGGNSTYYHGAAARANLVDSSVNNWTITDGGEM